VIGGTCRTLQAGSLPRIEVRYQITFPRYRDRWRDSVLLRRAVRKSDRSRPRWRPNRRVARVAGARSTALSISISPKRGLLGSPLETCSGARPSCSILLTVKDNRGFADVVQLPYMYPQYEPIPIASRVSAPVTPESPLPALCSTRCRRGVGFRTPFVPTRSAHLASLGSCVGTTRVSVIRCALPANGHTEAVRW
jgi:hypothetical protein